MMDISLLQSLYSGFHIDEPVGNNAFSFSRRRNQIIFVPTLIEGGVDDVAPGEDVVFSEIADGGEVNAKGLERFVHFEHEGGDVFVFDNHNHAFCFWYEAIVSGVMPLGLPLVHVDQHKDMRVPQLPFPSEGADLEQAFYYTNEVLNVGNFIPPALSLGWFSEVIQVGTRETFDLDLPKEFVLDIDMDMFAPVMDYIPLELKLSRLRAWILRARFITISTSPFFMDQTKAISLFRQLFAENKA
jgi:hypothetical protein